MFEIELLENENVYEIVIQQDDTFFTMSYLSSWYDYIWDMYSIKKEEINDFNFYTWKNNFMIIPISNEFYPYFLNLYEKIAVADNDDLFDEENQTITWLNDDYNVAVGKDNNFQIIKVKEGIKIVFNYTYQSNVRICTNGSQHGDFYIPFSELFSDLKNKIKKLKMK